MNLRKELLTLKSTETEKKLKIVVYSKRVDELVETIDKTNVTLTQFKDNILKVRLQSSCSTNTPRPAA